MCHISSVLVYVVNANVLLLCLVARAFIERQQLSIQGNMITVSHAPAAAADIDSEDDDAGLRDDMLHRTVIVQDVSEDMEDVVCVYLENPRKNGGPIESLSYNGDSRQLTIRFVAQEGMYVVTVFCDC